MFFYVFYDYFLRMSLQSNNVSKVKNHIWRFKHSVFYESFPKMTKIAHKKSFPNVQRFGV